jgi:hypothetical protein
MSNLGDLLNGITAPSKGAADFYGNLIGTMADIQGAIGFLQLIGVLSSGPDLSDIQAEITNAFAQLDKVLEGDQILQRNYDLNEIIAPAVTQLEDVQVEANSNPSATDVNNYIGVCVTALNDLGGDNNADVVWGLTPGWPIYWTDAGEQYTSYCYYVDLFGNPSDNWGFTGYGLQSPPSDGLTVFYYTYSLPLYVRAVTIFLAVAGSLDPNFATNYALVIRTSAALLKSKHDLIFQTGLTPLAPANWTSDGLVKISCPSWNAPPTPGITLQYLDVESTTIPIFAQIEYGAVETYSGYSSMGDQYQIDFNESGGTDPATYYKFQIRLLKRTKDVYIGVGLLDVWQMIDNLNKIVGDPPLQGPSFGDWSLREIFALSNLGQTVVAGSGVKHGYSLRDLGAFIIGTQPQDTPYWPGATSFTLRTLLTDFPTSPPG